MRSSEKEFVVDENTREVIQHTEISKKSFSQKIYFNCGGPFANTIKICVFLLSTQHAAACRFLGVYVENAILQKISILALKLALVLPEHRWNKNKKHATQKKMLPVLHQKFIAALTKT